jgi:hypothetical protein
VVLVGRTCRWFDVKTGQEVRHCDLLFPESRKKFNWKCF